MVFFLANHTSSQFFAFIMFHCIVVCFLNGENTTSGIADIWKMYGVSDTSFITIFRAQLGESIKTLILADYPEQWPSLLHWVTHNLESQDQIFGALYVLRILSRKYE
jgi:hypothetical protein